MTTPLLTTKLYMPPRRPTWMARPQLVERLSQNLSRKLTLLSAPAGYGKTTLLSEWLTPLLPEVRVAWLSLEEADDDPARFLAYIVAALRAAELPIDARIVGPSSGRRPPPGQDVLGQLVNQLSALLGKGAAAQLVLVLDDYHFVQAQSVHDDMVFLLDHLPAGMHLVVATRVDPPFPLARLRGRGELNELRLAELRFSPQEVAEFLSRCMGLELSADEIATMAGRTEGWVAGLQMAGLSLQRRDRHQVSSFIQAFTGSHRHVLDYLIEEVLDQQPPEVQAFLLDTSILDRLTGPLCNAVLGRAAGAQAMLESLDRSNLFVVPLDDDRTWYRYHHLFADLLRKRLAQFHRALVPELHRRASAWYEAAALSAADLGLMTEAIEHALHARDYDRAARLIEGSGEAVLMRSEVSTVLDWIERLPEKTVCAEPMLCALQAGAMLLDGRPLEAVQTRLAQADQESAGPQVRGAVAAFRALIAAMQGDAARSTVLSREALDALPKERTFLRSLVADNLGVTYLIAGDIKAAMEAFAQAAEIARQTGNVLIAVGALSNLAGLQMVGGDLVGAQANYERALNLATNEQGGYLPVATKALLGLGELARERYQLEAAAGYLEQAIQLTERFGVLGGIAGIISLAQVRQAQGDLVAAEELVGKAEGLAIKFDATETDDELVAACRAQLWIAQGDLEAAAGWAERRRLYVGEPGGMHHLLHESEQLVVARLNLAHGRPDEALSVLAPLLEAAEEVARERSLVRLLVLQAQAHQMAGDTSSAVAALARAVSMAHTQDYVHAFVGGGEVIARLLPQVAAQGIAPDYIQRLLATFPQVPPASMPVAAPGDGVLIEPLSEREREVLPWLASHLSSTEMAAELGISANTVRFHIKNIYTKLNVHSRVEAVQRARELALL